MRKSVAPGVDRHAFAHVELGDHAGDRRAQRDARLHACRRARPLRSAPRSCRAAAAAGAPRAAAARRPRRASAAARGTPPAPQPSRGRGSRPAARLPAPGRAARARSSFSTKPRGACLHHARRRARCTPRCRPPRASASSDPGPGLGGAHAEVLRDARVDRDAARVAAASSAYFGTSCMSMKGDLPGLSKRCCGIHRVVPVEHLAFRPAGAGRSRAAARWRRACAACAYQ